MISQAKTVEQYLSGLLPDRRAALEAVREVILANLDKDYQEGIQYGMIGYFVPHSVYPAGYHCDPNQALPFAGLASQKNYMSLYLMCAYGNSKLAQWFREEWAKTGKKLDMGKSCVRFKKLEDLPLDLIGKTIARVPAKTYIECIESAREASSSGSRPRRAKASTAKKAETKKKRF